MMQDYSFNRTLKLSGKLFLLGGFLFGLSHLSYSTLVDPIGGSIASNLGLLVVSGVFLLAVIAQFLPER